MNACDMCQAWPCFCEELDEERPRARRSVDLELLDDEAELGEAGA